MAETQTQNPSAQTPKPPRAAAKTDKKKLMVTYKPQPGDPSEVKWNGHIFHANVPRPVIDDGNPHGMVALAKGNMCFEVEGHDKKAAPDPGAPKTPEEYRVYAINWFKKARSADEFEQRWDDEEEMREEAGVGTDDVEWLNSIGGPILADLKKADQA